MLHKLRKTNVTDFFCFFISSTHESKAQHWELNISDITESSNVLATDRARSNLKPFTSQLHWEKQGKTEDHKLIYTLSSGVNLVHGLSALIQKQILIEIDQSLRAKIGSQWLHVATA